VANESVAVDAGVPEITEAGYFVGREMEIDRIDRTTERIQATTIEKIVVLLGGIGKTLRAYANGHGGDYPAMFWPNSKDVDALE
jgi:hypothetical protein